MQGFALGDDCTSDEGIAELNDQEDAADKRHL